MSWRNNLFGLPKLVAMNRRKETELFSSWFASVIAGREKLPKSGIFPGMAQGL